MILNVKIIKQNKKANQIKNNNNNNNHARMHGRGDVSRARMLTRMKAGGEHEKSVNQASKKERKRMHTGKIKMK